LKRVREPDVWRQARAPASDGLGDTAGRSTLRFTGQALRLVGGEVRQVRDGPVGEVMVGDHVGDLVSHHALLIGLRPADP
jgi:hypothetical protein